MAALDLTQSARLERHVLRALLQNRSQKLLQMLAASLFLFGPNRLRWSLFRQQVICEPRIEFALPSILPAKADEPTGLRI
ncbi:MAG TPA: hypothetical protein VGM06_13515 [Polyangiaceae bacterium]